MFSSLIDENPVSPCLPPLLPLALMLPRLALGPFEAPGSYGKAPSLLLVSRQIESCPVEEGALLPGHGSPLDRSIS